MSLSGDVLYFSYGSNMLTARLRARTPSAAPLGTAFLEGRRLVFHKLSEDGSGKCDIVAASSRVHGVLYRLAGDELGALDRAEGLGYGYRRDRIEVVTPSGVETALTYFAERTRDGLRPYRWYKALVVAGAIEHALPAPYVASLQAVEADPDPDAARRARNEAILS